MKKLITLLLLTASLYSEAQSVTPAGFHYDTTTFSSNYIKDVFINALDTVYQGQRVAIVFSNTGGADLYKLKYSLDGGKTTTEIASMVSAGIPYQTGPDLLHIHYLTIDVTPGEYVYTFFPGMNDYYVTVVADPINGLSEVNETREVLERHYYNAQGVEVSENTRGFVIEKTLYTNGQVSTQKRLL